MLIFGHRCIIAREADGVELDVVITPDRLLAVSHDPVPYPDPSLEEILSLDHREMFLAGVKQILRAAAAQVNSRA